MLRVSNVIKVAVVIAAVFAVLGNLQNILPDRWKKSIPVIADWPQVTLGLDLRGGAYLLLEVDEAELKKTRLAIYAEDLRRELRRFKIRIEQFQQLDRRITFTLFAAEDAEKLKDLLRDNFSFLEAEQEGSQWNLVLGEAQVTEELSFAVDQSLEVIRRRVDELGTREPQIYRQGQKRIVVALPGDEDPDRLKQLLGKVAKLTFQLVSDEGSLAHSRGLPLPPGTDVVDSYDKHSNGEPMYQSVVERRIYLTGNQLLDARPTIDENGQAIVQFRLDTRGSRSFERLTRSNVNRFLAVMFDDQIISSPRIRGPIGGGSVVIEGGNMTIEEAQDISLLMRSGALPVSLKVLEERTVGPGLGRDSIDSGMRAIWIGIVLVALYIFLIYRRFGLYTISVLGLNMILLLAVITVIGGTLSLPGMAGLVLTVGMMVDANILIYERIRDEYYRERGHDVLASVQRGFQNALSSILDSNLTTLLAAVVLVGLGSGPVRGFALTLSVGILTSLFTCLLLTRWLTFSWVSRKVLRDKSKETVLPF